MININRAWETEYSTDPNSDCHNITPIVRETPGPSEKEVEEEKETHLDKWSSGSVGGDVIEGSRRKRILDVDSGGVSTQGVCWKSSLDPGIRPVDIM